MKKTKSLATGLGLLLIALSLIMRHLFASNSSEFLQGFFLGLGLVFLVAGIMQKRKKKDE